MRINGRNRLACKTLIKDLDISQPIYVEAIKGLPLEKDLIVDMEPFFESYRQINPFLMAGAHAKDGKERMQSPVERARFDDTTKCILCAACTSSCPVFWTDGQYFGPAAIVNAHRFIFDSRDEGAAGAPRHPQRQGGRVALPHDLQLLRGVPPRHPGDPGDRRGQAGHPARQAVGPVRFS